MDGRSRYAKIVRVMNIIKDMDKINLNKLRNVIFMEIGCTERVLTDVISSMFEFIKEIDHLIFEINYNEKE